RVEIVDRVKDRPEGAQRLRLGRRASRVVRADAVRGSQECQPGHERKHAQEPDPPCLASHPVPPQIMDPNGTNPARISSQQTPPRDHSDGMAAAWLAVCKGEPRGFTTRMPSSPRALDQADEPGVSRS